MYIEYYYMNDKTIHRSKKFDSIINYNTIEILCCYNNSLNHLPNLPSNLIKLNCNETKLTNLPNLSNSLIELNCSYNNLISLRKININLKDFDYLNNFIKFVKFINKLHKKISDIKTTYYYYIK